MALKVTWQQLRSLAEATHGGSNERQGVRIADGKIKVEAFDEAQKDNYIFEVDAVTLLPKGPLKVQLPGMDLSGLASRLGRPIPGDDVFGVADSVFWTLSAVEKFLVPYYASYHDLDKVMTRIRKKFEEQDVLAFLHLPSSEPDTGTKALRPEVASLFAVTPADRGGTGYKLVPVI